MSMEGAMPNYCTINGKACPSTETLQMKVGEKVRVRFIGSNIGFIHPMHIHGGPFEIIAIDGEPVPEGTRQLQDTVNIAPGQGWVAVSRVLSVYADG
jgi:FtsP/CotA-like multicopper oxidase with cupredoxin domain